MSYTSLKIPLTFYHPQESLPIGMQILQHTIEKGRKWIQIKNTSNATDVYKVNGRLGMYIRVREEVGLVEP